MDSLGSLGLTWTQLDSQGLAAIDMGFKGFHMDVAAIYTGFQVVLLKTHANMAQSLHRALKTHAYGNNNIAKVPHGLTWSHIASFTFMVSHCLIHVHI